jgi:hypothetical protein
VGIGYAKYAADRLVSELHDRAVAVGHSAVARGQMPQTPEEFANAVVHVVFDALAAGLARMNESDGWHPDDPRWDAPHLAAGEQSASRRARDD